MIKSIEIRGFKSIAAETVRLGALNVLIGANGAGKTALLEAIGVLGAAADARVDDASLLRRGVRPGVPKLYKSAFEGAIVRRVIGLKAVSSDVPSAFYDVSLDNAIAAWKFTNESLGDDEDLPYMTRSPRGATFRMKGNVRKFKPGDQTRGLAGTPGPFGSPPASVARLVDALRGFIIYDPQTPVLRGTETDALQRDPVGVNGGRLAEAIEDVLTARNFGSLRLQDVLSLFAWAISLEISVPTADLISPSIPVPTKVVLFQDRFMKKGRNVLSGYDASEGALYVLFSLVLLTHPRAPRFYAIENIDHALHPRLARTLVERIADNAKRSERQVLLTTHNPLVLDGLDIMDDAVRLFAVDRDTHGRTRVSRIEPTQALAKARARGMVLSQMWTSGLLGAVPDLV